MQLGSPDFFFLIFFFPTEKYLALIYTSCFSSVCFLKWGKKPSQPYKHSGVTGIVKLMEAEATKCLVAPERKRWLI